MPCLFSQPLRLPTALVLLVITGLYGPIARADPGVSATEVVLGQSAAFEGGSAALGNELWRGAQAYFDVVNAQGGIQGRKIRVISLDDGYDPTRTLANTVDLALKQQVFALFGYVGTPTLLKALPLIRKLQPQHLFLFSDFTGAAPQRESPNDRFVFNVRASYRQETEGLVQHLVALGLTRIALFIQDDAYGRSGADGVASALKTRGLQIVTETTYQRGARFAESMAAQVQLVRDAKAQAVIAVGSYEPCAAFIRDARAAGEEAPIANLSFVGADALLSLLAREGQRAQLDLTRRVVVSQVVPPWSETSFPLVAAYRAAIDRYDPQRATASQGATPAADRYSFAGLEGYLNARVFGSILARAPGDLTREGFVQAVDATADLDVGLGATRLSFSGSKHQGLDQVFFTAIEHGHWVTLSDWTKLR